MDASIVVGVQGPLDLQLLLEVGLELGVDVVHDGLVTVGLVDLISKTDGIHHGQLQSDVAFLQLCAGWL